ncbi:MAG TPA: type II secretion system F family protein [Terriglobia bacterium]|nr:type II secretion system F family protein [Terriglobia bacterium]
MEFVCKVGTPAGRVLSQTEQAASEPELRQRLASEGYYIFSLQAKGGLEARLRAGRRKKLKADDFVIFNQQFLTLSKSGLPLHKSLELLAHQTRSEALREGLEDVRDRVRSGALISEAFESSGRFPKIYCATLRAGERSGSMDKVLAQYVTYQKISRGFRKKFLAALIYPALLMLFLVVLISLVVGFVVPRFSALYSDLQVKMPPLTLFVINLSVAFKHYAWVFLAGVVLAALGARQLWKSPEVKLAWDRFKYRQPVVGKLLLKFSVAEFARTFGTLLQGGLPVMQALETARHSVTSPLMVQAIAAAEKEVSGGRSLTSSLRQTGFFPAAAIDMMEIGEGTGALSAMLESMAEFFEEDVNVDLATLISLVDPVMIALIAIVVAFVLVAFYLPLFSLAGQVG